MLTVDSPSPRFFSTSLQSNLIHSLGLSHHLITLNFIIISFGKKSARSSPRVKVTDTDFDGVEVRVFEGPPKPDEPLRRSVVYIHGGGWALASASKSPSSSGGSVCLALGGPLGSREHPGFHVALATLSVLVSFMWLWPRVVSLSFLPCFLPVFLPVFLCVFPPTARGVETIAR